MKKMMRFMTLVLLTVAAVPWAWGGNREMIENRVRELHDLNRQVIDGLPGGTPRDGTVDIRATVYPREGTIRIENIQDTSPDAGATPQVFEETPERYVPFKAALARYREKPIQIVGIPGPPDSEHYTPFSEGIRRLARRPQPAATR